MEVIWVEDPIQVSLFGGVRRRSYTGGVESAIHLKKQVLARPRCSRASHLSHFVQPEPHQELRLPACSKRYLQASPRPRLGFRLLVEDWGCQSPAPPAWGSGAPCGDDSSDLQSKLGIVGFGVPWFGVECVGLSRSQVERAQQRFSEFKGFLDSSALAGSDLS